MMISKIKIRVRHGMEVGGVFLTSISKFIICVLNVREQGFDLSTGAPLPYFSGGRIHQKSANFAVFQKKSVSLQLFHTLVGGGGVLRPPPTLSTPASRQNWLPLFVYYFRSAKTNKAFYHAADYPCIFKKSNIFNPNIYHTLFIDYVKVNQFSFFYFAVVQ